MNLRQIQRWLTLSLQLWFISFVRSQTTEIIITDSKVKVFNQFIYFDEHNLKKTNQVLNHQEYTGKICHGNNIETVNKCIDLFEPYNKQWILLVSDKDYLESLTHFINSNKYTRIQAVIANNSTITPSELKMTNFNYPLFSCSQDDFDQIIQYDIFDEIENYFARLIYQSEYFKIVNQFGFYVIVVILILSITIPLGWIIWMYKLRDYFPDNIQTIQSLLQYFSYLKAVVAAVYVYYFSVCKKTQTNNQSTLIKAYVDVVMMTLDSINISVFWIFLLMISNGWFLYKIEFSHIQAIRLTIGYIVFFSLVLFDQVIDMVMDQKIISNLTFSDLKNVILYTILIVVCHRWSFDTLKQLKRKYTYSYYYAMEFMGTLKLKVLLIKWHLGICIAYWILTVIHLGVVKTIIEDETIIQVIWANFDLIIFCVLLMVYRPRKFSRFYFIYEENDENEQLSQFGHIYRLKCKKKTIDNNKYQYSNIISDDHFDKEEIIQIRSSIRQPIIIIPPFASQNMTVGFCINEIFNNSNSSIINLI